MRKFLYLLSVFLALPLSADACDITARVVTFRQSFIAPAPVFALETGCQTQAFIAPVQTFIQPVFVPTQPVFLQSFQTFQTFEVQRQFRQQSFRRASFHAPVQQQIVVPSSGININIDNSRRGGLLGLRR